MFKFVASIVLAATVAFTPLASIAQTAQAGASDVHNSQIHRPTGSYKSQMRQRSNMSRERARAGAEHVRKMHVQ